MNIIEFLKIPYDAVPGDFGVDVNVDGRRLVQIMQDVEKPMAKAEGSPSIAGSYAAIPVPDGLKRYYLGEHDLAWGRESDKTLVLDCECGQPGCWPLLCKINDEGGTVRWTRFEQPRRGPDSKASFWDYSGFAGFAFEKAQYMAALAQLLDAD